MNGRLEFIKAKKQNSEVKTRKSLQVSLNGRSADFIIPSFATGCQLGCLYCYVARHKPLGNSLTTYTNVDEILQAVKHHVSTLGPKTPNQCDPHKWTYDIGESTDCLTPAVIETTNKVIQYLVHNTEAKPTFATKLCSGPKLLLPVPKGSARVRTSLIPQRVATRVEIGTSQVKARIESIQGLLDLGYEVHVNFSPVIVYQGWLGDYKQLFSLVDSTLSDEAKLQLKAEVIFLTHSPKLHDINKLVDPFAEALMWQPSLQEYKTNNRGQSDVLRYKAELKSGWIADFKSALAEVMPYCKIRYIF